MINKLNTNKMTTLKLTQHELNLVRYGISLITEQNIDANTVRWNRADALEDKLDKLVLTYGEYYCKQHNKLVRR